MNQSLNVYLPGSDETSGAQEAIGSALGDAPAPTHDDNVLAYLRGDDSDVHVALARLRMDLERQLRRVLERQLADDALEARNRGFSAAYLFRRLVGAIPKYGPMKKSFDYVINACNAAIHGRHVPENVAYETIDMGLRLLRELENEPVAGQRDRRD